MVNRNIQLTFFFLLFGLTAILTFMVFKPYINVLILSGTFAIIFYPIYKELTKKGFGKKFPSFTSFIVVVLASIIVFTPLVFLGTRVFSEATDLYNQVTDPARSEYPPLGDIRIAENPLLRRAQERFEGALSIITADLDVYAQKSLGWVINNAGGVFKGVASFGLAVFIWFLSFYYFLRDGERIKKLFLVLSPLSDRYDIEIVKRIVRSVKSVIGGSLIVAIIQGILAGIGLAIFGVPAPAIWGFVAVIAALVPTIGTALVMLPAIGYLFLIGSTIPAFGLLIWAVLIVSSIDNILRPKLIEKGINIHPLAILLSVLGGIALFGPIGFLIGPILISLLAEFVVIYDELVVKQKN